MKALFRILLILGVSTLSGCIAGRPYVFSHVKMTALVLDSLTEKPIQGASLRLVARGRHTGKVKVWDWLKTDASGLCVIEVPQETTWIGLSESFAGGFKRGLEVKASGYRTSYPLEELEYVPERLEYTYPFKDPKIHVIKLRPEKEPIQPPQTTTGSSAPDRV